MVPTPPDYYNIRESGNANVYHLYRNGDWFAVIQFNGEVWSDQQDILMRKIVEICSDPELNAVLKKRR